MSWISTPGSCGIGVPICVFTQFGPVRSCNLHLASCAVLRLWKEHLVTETVSNWLERFVPWHVTARMSMPHVRTLVCRSFPATVQQDYQWQTPFYCSKILVSIPDRRSRHINVVEIHGAACAFRNIPTQTVEWNPRCQVPEKLQQLPNSDS